MLWAVLALAVSFDGFGVGLTYGARQIRIPLISIVIIAICSTFVMYLSMRAGDVLTGWMSDEAASRIGAVILVGIGLWAVVQTVIQHNGDRGRQEQGIRHDDRTASVRQEAKSVFYLEIRRLGLVIEILRKPVRADVDRSGNISAVEALLLGAALSLDALGAGIGAALVGLPALPTACLIGAACGTFLYVGLKLGNKISHVHWLSRLSVLPGLVLIIIGIFKWF